MNFEGTEYEMQALAKDLNKPVTVFILKSTLDHCDFKLRFFGTESEISMCGHGTIAAASYLFSKGHKEVIHAEISRGIILEISSTADKLVQFTTEKAKKIAFDINTDFICSLIGLTDKSLLNYNLPLCVASIGSPKLLVPLTNKEGLFSLCPDFDNIKRWSIENEVNGVYVYTQDTIDQDSDFLARSFNPKSGTNEDIATGVAAAALVSIIADTYDKHKTFIVEQGYNLHTPSKIIVSAQENTLKVGGLTHVGE